MSGGGNTSGTQTTKVKPWGPTGDLLKGTVYPEYERLFQQGLPQAYPGATYVSRDPLEDYAQAEKLRFAQEGMPGMVGNIQSANQFMLNAPDVASNPYVGGMADVIQDRMTRQFQEGMMPQIAGNAVMAGQMGGGRQGVAEGLAAERVSQATGDALAQLYGDAYGQGLDQQYRGMATAPQSMMLSMMPAETIGGVGAYVRGEQEKALADDMSKYDINSMIPFNTLDWMNAGISGTPWGQTTAGPSGTGTSGLQSAIGGGLLGASMVPAAGSAAESALFGMGFPMGAAGLSAWPFALGGALLGGLGGGLFS